MPKLRHVADPTRTPPPEVIGYHPGRPPWSAPKGRDLLAGIAVLAVLVAVLVVFSRERPSPRPDLAASQALPRARGAAAAAPAADWTEVPIATSVVELGPSLAQPVADGLAAARARIDRCVVVERRKASVPAPAAGAGAGATELVLQLVGRSGAVHVVGVELNQVGRSPQLADCARRHLDGDAFPATYSVPGRRQRLLLTLE